MDDDDELLQSFTSLKIPKTHATVGISNLISSNKQYRSLFVNRRLPDAGWSNVQIQHFLFILSTLDTNNKVTVDCSMGRSDGIDGSSIRWCGVGEREGRVYSSLVAQRHFGFGHGVGRSGDISEPQPKAVGSSIMAKLTLLLVLDAIRRGSGLNATTASKNGILLPLCTGMSMSLLLSALREKHPTKNIVLWSRIDQKSCFKAISSAGLTCVVVPTKLNGEEVRTDLDSMKAALEKYKGSVLAVVTTTSCFAPRVPDQVDEVAKLCKSQLDEVYHVINNAYGLQCPATVKLINRACVVGRVDGIVCSTDKNFLVPVGGAIILSPELNVIESVSKLYAGRASGSPMMDLFITLLSMGLLGYKQLLENRANMVDSFSAKFNEVAAKHGERLLVCKSNTISFGITLDQLARSKNDDEVESVYLQSVKNQISRFGAMLFTRCVSGTRVVPRGDDKVISGEEFIGFGSSINNFPHAYLTAACAIGATDAEISEFFLRLDRTFHEYKKIANGVRAN